MVQPWLLKSLPFQKTAFHCAARGQLRVALYQRCSRSLLSVLRVEEQSTRGNIKRES
jgi:hypothetical protein